MYVFQRNANDAHYSDSTADNTTEKSVDLPEGTRGFYIQVQSNGVWLTFDGSSPSDTNGLYLPSGTLPVFFPVVTSDGLTWISDNASGSKVDILWLS